MTQLYLRYLSRVKSALNFNLNDKWEPARQPREFSTNPFVAENGLPIFQVPNLTDTSSLTLRFEVYDYIDDHDKEQSKVDSDSMDPDKEWGNSPPVWLDLFYDLAWTASIASLNSNSQFENVGDMFSYIAFFITLWWMWVTEVFYTAEYYTDDWVHLIVVCLQLIVYGTLAATTRGFHLSDFITHTPGSMKLEDPAALLRPEFYIPSEIAYNSLRVIMLAIALSRLLLLMKYIRVAIYAKITPRTDGIFPSHLLVIPTGLSISTIFFFAAYGVASGEGKTPDGARTKFILALVALFVEMITHILRFQVNFDGQSLRVLSHGSIVPRFCSITIIILGEGVNGMVQNLYTLQIAPIFKTSDAASLLCCAIIIFFLAYLYFESPAPLRTVKRRIAWAFAHLIWLLSIVLLLEGLKGQVLLLNYFTSTEFLQSQLESVTLDKTLDFDEFKRQVGQVLVQGGLEYNYELGLYAEMERMNQTNGGDIKNPQVHDELVGVWLLREEMKVSVSLYKQTMPPGMINPVMRRRIDQYYLDYNYTLQDFSTDPSKSANISRDILSDLLSPQIENARYVTALCGATFISLANLNLIQAWPKDRFQWTSIITRYAIGAVMTLLLLLNLGKYQSYFAPEDMKSQRAPVYTLFSGAWGLPVLAIVYVIQFIVDTILLHVSARYSAQIKRRAEEEGEKLIQSSTSSEDSRDLEIPERTKSRRRRSTESCHGGL